MDATELVGKQNGNGARQGAVALPEVACPLGVYFAYPPEVDPGRRGGQETAFAAFDGTNQQPLDARGIVIDMNGDRVRDQRETVNQAWHRLGLLKPGQKLTAAVYQSCVKEAVSKLVKQGLLPAKVGEYYVEKASKTHLLN